MNSQIIRAQRKGEKIDQRLFLEVRAQNVIDVTPRVWIWRTFATNEHGKYYVWMVCAKRESGGQQSFAFEDEKSDALVLAHYIDHCLKTGKTVEELHLDYCKCTGPFERKITERWPAAIKQSGWQFSPAA